MQVHSMAFTFQLILINKCYVPTANNSGLFLLSVRSFLKISSETVGTRDIVILFSLIS